MGAPKKNQEQPILHTYFEDAIKKIVYDAVRTVFEHVQSKPEKKEIPPIFGIDICEEVTGLARPTIYRNTSKKLMPHYLRDGKLLFKRDEIYAWLTENRIKTKSELIQELDEEFVAKREKQPKSKKLNHGE